MTSSDNSHTPLSRTASNRSISVAVLIFSLIALVGLAPVAQAGPAVQHTGPTWSGWSEVPGNGLTTDAPETVNYHGANLVFVRGTDNHIYLNRLADGIWSGWSEVPGGGQTLSAPAAVVYRHDLRLYVHGTDDHIYVNRLGS